MSDYTLEELLNAVGEAPEKESSPVSDTKIGEFVDQFNIETGLDRISTYVIYFTYRVKHKGELSKIEFFRQFNKQFTQARTGKQRSYKLNGNSFDLSREGKLEAEFYGKKRQKEEERSGKISRTKRKRKSKAKT